MAEPSAPAGGHRHGMSDALHEIPTWGWWVMAIGAGVVVYLRARSAASSPSVTGPAAAGSADVAGAAVQSGDLVGLNNLMVQSEQQTTADFAALQAQLAGLAPGTNTVNHPGGFEPWANYNQPGSGVAFSSAGGSTAVVGQPTSIWDAGYLNVPGHLITVFTPLEVGPGYAAGTYLDANNTPQWINIFQGQVQAPNKQVPSAIQPLVN